MPSALPLLFFAVALVYSMAGFGGGSTYTALLAISGLPLLAIPVLSLVCNLLVSSQGSYLLIRGGHAHWRLLRPLLAMSIPAAFLGARLELAEGTFIVLLATALTFAGISLVVQSLTLKTEREKLRVPRPMVLLMTGGVLGFVAGVTGIGGGIYLAPVMHLLGWAKPRVIATCTSLFIALNSLAGLLGQLFKQSEILESIPFWLLLACPLSVLIGGNIGSRLLSSKLPQAQVRALTAVVVLLVAVRLWLNILID